jgi:hypothetical protein
VVYSKKQKKRPSLIELESLAKGGAVSVTVALKAIIVVVSEIVMIGIAIVQEMAGRAKIQPLAISFHHDAVFAIDRGSQQKFIGRPMRVMAIGTHDDPVSGPCFAGIGSKRFLSKAIIRISRSSFPFLSMPIAGGTARADSGAAPIDCQQIS